MALPFAASEHDGLAPRPGELHDALFDGPVQSSESSLIDAERPLLEHAERPGHLEADVEAGGALPGVDTQGDASADTFGGADGGQLRLRRVVLDVESQEGADGEAAEQQDSDAVSTSVSSQPASYTTLDEMGLQAAIVDLPALGDHVRGLDRERHSGAFRSPQNSGGSDEGAAEHDKAPDERWFTIEDLKTSWTMTFLQTFFAWSLLLALVVIAGFSCNLFLNMFIDFNQNKEGSFNDLSVQTWVLIVTLCTKALLFALLAAGLMQRGTWLFLDALQHDTFRDYRRTLCCEGPGPGNFPLHRRLAVLKDPGHVRAVHRALTSDCTLEYGVLIGRTKIYAGSQLLAVEAMEGKVCANDVLDVDLPAKLVFRVDARPTGFRGMECCGGFRATMDIIFQWIIYGSFIGVPIGAVLLQISVGSILSFRWLNTLVATSVIVSVVHVCIYFAWSTLLDYWWKLRTFIAMLQQLGVRCCGTRLFGHARSAAQTPTSGVRSRDEAASPPAENADGAAENPAVARHNSGPREHASRRNIRIAEERRLEDQAENTLGVAVRGATQSASYGAGRERRRQNHEEDFLNVCVCFRNMLVTRFAQVVLVFIAFGLIIACFVLLGVGKMDRFQKLIISFFLGAVFAIFLFVRFRLGAVGRRAARQFARMVQLETEGASAGLWALWFRVNCGFDPFSVFVREFILAAACIALGAVGFMSEKPELEIVMMPICLWSIVVMAVCVVKSNDVWKFMILQSGFFALLSIVTAVYSAQDHGNYLKGSGWVALIAFGVQAGMSRFGRTQGHAIFLAFFVIIVVVIAAITFSTAASATGLDFGLPPLEFCSNKSADFGNCTEFTFPLHGSRPRYGFCGLSWPMCNASNPKCLSVSERCPDMMLTLADFGAFSRVSSYLPDMDFVGATVDKYLPGWEVVYHQHYNVTDHLRNTFVHLRRGATNVVAVRGTSSAAEVLQDANFWLPAGFLQLTQIAGPSLFNIRNIMGLITGGITQYRANQMQNLYDYMKKLTDSAISGNESETDAVYITGHSLGGGLAAAIGGMLNIPAVTFSAPGLTATSSILNPEPQLQTLRHNGVNVVPNGDLVPMVDKQSGQVLPIDCPFENPLACHQLFPTMCEILASCGDGGGRGIPRGYVRTCDTCASSGQSFDRKSWGCPPLPED